MTFFSALDTPIGRLLLVSRRADHLSGIYMEDHARGPLHDAAWIQDEARFSDVRRQLGEYFAGVRTKFTLPLALEGTPFQKSVWSVLLEIPYGATISYAELAKRVGTPRAARAVGGANARNPISIVVPCHRVVGADGALTGYAGGEERKRWLLDFERQRATRATAARKLTSAVETPCA
jgi:methylated-DNA-[protein]-cysteine S-methyltransferase